MLETTYFTDASTYDQMKCLVSTALAASTSLLPSPSSTSGFGSSQTVRSIYFSIDLCFEMKQNTQFVTAKTP